MSPTSEQALLIFTRNPELGKCKTRLAATVGDPAALSIYTFLLEKTAAVTSGLSGVDRHVFFSEHLGDGTIWHPRHYRSHLQKGKDLGERMQRAVEEVLAMGYTKVVIIGSDLFDLFVEDLREAFKRLDTHDAVLGPASDGGYYLLGLTQMIPELFRSKAWGGDTVLKDTLSDLKGKKVHLLEERTDVDRYEDIAGRPEFEPFLKHLPDDPKTTR